MFGRLVTPSVLAVESSMICFLCERYSNGRRSRSPTGEVNHDSDSIRVNCPRCGEYDLSGELFEAVPGGLKEEHGLILSGLIRAENDRRHSVPLPGNKRRRTMITQENFQALLDSAPSTPTYTERVNWLLVDLARRCLYPGRITEPFSLEPLAARVYLPLLACAALLEQMHTAAGLIGILTNDPLNCAVTLSPTGWVRVDELQAVSPRSDKAFVAMWFDNKLSTAYELGIKPALQGCGYKLPFRVDDKEIDSSGYVPKIDDRIMAAIRRARFLVADITGARVAVYFEAGFAEGLGIPIIWTCRKASAKKDMCFDTRQHEHILWTEPEDLRAALVAKIGARGWDRTIG